MTFLCENSFEKLPCRSRRLDPSSTRRRVEIFFMSLPTYVWDLMYITIISTIFHRERQMRNDFVRRRFEKKFEIDREISYDHTISSSNLIDCVHVLSVWGKRRLRILEKFEVRSFRFTKTFREESVSLYFSEGHVYWSRNDETWSWSYWVRQSIDDRWWMIEHRRSNTTYH